MADHFARDDFQVGVLVFESERVGHEAVVHAGVGLLCPRDLQLIDILAYTKKKKWVKLLKMTNTGGRVPFSYPVA